jgi:hypothetical protein
MLIDYNVRFYPDVETFCFRAVRTKVESVTCLLSFRILIPSGS